MSMEFGRVGIYQPLYRAPLHGSYQSGYISADDIGFEHGRAAQVERVSWLKQGIGKDL